MSLSRALILGIPLSILAASCGPPPEPTPPTTGAPPPASASAPATATAAPEPAEVASPAGTVSINGATACAVVSGRVACWGDNSREIFAAGHAPQPKPVLVPGIEGAVKVVVAKAFGCALTKAGQVACFTKGKAREISLLKNVADIAVQSTLLMVVKKDGSLAGLDLGYDGEDSNPAEMPGLKGITAISAGESHACALHRSGEVTCWGEPEYTGGGVDTSEMDYEEREKLSKDPVKLEGLKDVVQISAGDQHTCVVRKTKQILCWGSNWSGELGDGSQEKRVVPSQVQLIDDATAVVAGHGHTCARRESGKVLCWGENRYGQLGSGKPGSRGMVEVQGMTGAVALAAGENVSCAALATGGVQCWGAASRGRLGNGVLSDDPTPRPVKGASGAAAIAAGDRLSCMVDANKKVLCWGMPGFSSDWEGKRGFTPSPVPGIGEIESLSLHENGVCYIDKTKNAFCDSSYGIMKEKKPMKIGAVKAVSGSSSSGAGLLASGQVFLWQHDWDKEGAVRKQNLAGLADVVSMAGTGTVVCGVRRSGKVGCVGHGYRVFDKKDPLKPAAAVDVPDVKDATAIVSGSGEFCVLRKTGEVTCFNAYRVPQPVDPKVPAPPTKEKPRPIELRPVKKVSDAVQIAAGENVRCAILKDATVKCWGSNSYGQLGLGDYEHRWDPEPVPGLTDVVQMAVGGSQVCALKKGGDVLCWGSNHADQSGQSAASYEYAPVAALLPAP